MSRETDTFRVSQEGMYIITGTNSRHGITVSAGVRATIVLQDANLCDLETWVLHSILRKTVISR